MPSRIGPDRGLTIRQAAMPIRALLRRLSFFLLLSASFAIILIGRSDRDAMEDFRMTIVESVVPVIDVLSSPIVAWENTKLKFKQMIFVYNENKLLRDENDRLKRIEAVADKLEIENRRLRELVHFIPDKTSSYISARIITSVSGPYTRSVLIAAGEEQNMEKGRVVINNEGLVGRVIEVGRDTARILLITDINSKVPVVTGTSGERGMVEGDNSNELNLIHLPLDSKVVVGERVVTSGDGQFFPPGVPVGIVESVSNKVVTVKPFVDWSRLEYVSIGDFNLQQ